MAQPDPYSSDTTPSGPSETPSIATLPVGAPKSNVIELGVLHCGAVVVICAAAIFLNVALNRSVEPAGMIVGISYGYSTLLATWFVLGKSPYCIGGSLTLGCALNLFVPILFVIIYAGDMPAGILPVSFTYVVFLSALIFSYATISRKEVRHRRDISEEYSEELPFGIRDLMFATVAAAVLVAVGKALFMLSNDRSDRSVSSLLMTTPFFIAIHGPILITVLTEGQRLLRSVIAISLCLIFNLVELSIFSSMRGLRTLSENLMLLGSFNAPFLVVIGIHLAIVRLCGYQLVMRAEARSEESMQDFKD